MGDDRDAPVGMDEDGGTERMTEMWVRSAGMK